MSALLPTKHAKQTNLALLLPLLATIMALSPFAIDLYLPAMPVIAESLNSDMAMMQNTLSIYLLGYAAGLIFFGPLSDKYPRRNMVLIGLSGFAFFTLILPFCFTIEQFFLVRFLQAFICSAATVVVPGTIREYYGKDTAKGLSYVSMIMMIAPMIAPSIGSLLLYIDEWPLIFYCLFGYALIVLSFSAKYLPNRQLNPQIQQIEKSNKAVEITEESLVEKVKHVNFIGRYKVVLSHQGARLDLISSMMVSLAFFAYITAIPFVYLTVFDVSEFTFSLLFALNVIALMCAHFINTRLVVRKGSRKMLSFGIIVALMASTSLVLVNYFSLSIAYTVVSLIPLMGSTSIIAVNSDALILQEFAEQSGTATAVIGTLRFGIGALAGPILVIFNDGSALPFALLMWCSVIVVLLSQLPHFQRNNAVEGE